MFGSVLKIKCSFNKMCNFSTSKYFSLKNTHLDVSEEVMFAMKHKKPIVALESTIITHGMPFPRNINCALEVEQIVRSQGAVPATIAIVNGRVKVGLSAKEIEHLGDTKISRPLKTSRRDMAYVVSNKLNGGTTVSGTLVVANQASIPVFATGGIGGVHRGADKTFDVSADLVELGKCGLAVVSSGVKSILDIPKTLEYLETQGVFVATFGDFDEFPAFYSRASGSKAPYRVENAIKAAHIIKSNRDINMNSGMLFAVPVPKKYAMDTKVISKTIEDALKTAENDPSVHGKNVTPYLLAQVANITKGKSLETNIALIKNNAKTAADVAVELSKLDSEYDENENTSSEGNVGQSSRPVVIGGSNFDCSVTLSTNDIKLDGRIHAGNFEYTAGGVARNICESLCKLGCPVNFISAIGDDDQGKILRSFVPVEGSCLMETLQESTAQCIVVFDDKGECKFLMGDMEIHKRITPDVIKSHENVISTSPLIIFDGNLSLETMDVILQMAEKYNIPVFFEPTDLEISSKPFQTFSWRAIKFITPNYNELKHIARHLNVPSLNNYKKHIHEAADIATKLVDYVDNVIVTLGPDGVLIARKGLVTDPLIHSRNSNQIYVRHYPASKIAKVVNVSGAGDCFASGFIAGLISGLSEEKCVSVGFAAAYEAIRSKSAVPVKMFDKSHLSWIKSADFITL